LESWKLSKRLIEAGKPEGALESNIFKFELGLEDIPIIREGTITIPLERTTVEVKGMARPILGDTGTGFVRTDIISGAISGLGLDIGPRIKPITEPSVKPFIRPSAKPSIRIEPTIRPIIKPIVEPSIRPIMKPSIKPIIMPITQPVMKPIMKPIIKPVIKPKVKPKILPLPMPQPRPVTPSLLIGSLKLPEGIGIKRKRKRKYKRKYRYQPSVYGKFFTRPIRKAPKRLTGLEPRPLVIGKIKGGMFGMARRRKKRRKKKKR